MLGPDLLADGPAVAVLGLEEVLHGGPKVVKLNLKVLEDAPAFAKLSPNRLQDGHAVALLGPDLHGHGLW